MADFNVEARSQHRDESIVRAKRRATGSSGTSGNRHRTRVYPAKKRLKIWSKSFMPAVGEPRTDRICVGAPVGIHRLASGCAEERQPAVVEAAKIRHKPYIPIEVVRHGGASTMQV